MKISRTVPSRLERSYPVADLLTVVSEDHKDMLYPLGKGLEVVLTQEGRGHANGVALLFKHR